MKKSAFTCMVFTYFDKIYFGAIPLLVITILNDYVLPFGLNGFGVGASFLKLSALFLIIYRATGN